MFKDIFDKNTLLGLILILAMLGTYVFFSKKKIDSMPKSTPIAMDTMTKFSPIAKVADTSIDSIYTPKNTSPEVLAPSVQKSLKNKLVKIEINTLGAQINNVDLLTHKTHDNKDVILLSDKNTKWNFSFNTSQGLLTTEKENFTATLSNDTLLELQSPQGIKVIFRLSPNSYVVQQSWKIPNIKNSNGSKCQIQTEMNLAELNLKRERQYSSLYYKVTSDEVLKYLNKNKNEELQVTDAMEWISFGQQFFNATIVPSKGFSKGNISSYYMDADTGYVKKYQAEMTLAPFDSLEIKYFVGPSSYKLLKNEGNNLDLIVPLSQDFVLFRWVKIFNIYFFIPFFDFLSRYISNYGLIILIITFLIKLILMPLSFKMYKSGVAMKIMKPELDVLKKKYGDDQQKYSQEQMKLYNEVGINPLGAGCLPMLLQMPILFAMFNFFPSSIELRHQPFLWAHDLSTYDNILTLPFTIPFYGNHVSLFALLMTLTQIGTTLYSQRLQPSGGPQAEQMKMMAYIMPVMMLFMFNSFPAALVFYYLLQNVFSIVQQWFVTKFIIDESKVKAEMALARKSPKKKSGFQQKIQDLMEQAEEQKKLQQNNTKK